jgi:hypothetical protein
MVAVAAEQGALRISSLRGVPPSELAVGHLLEKLPATVFRPLGPVRRGFGSESFNALNAISTRSGLFSS